MAYVKQYKFLPKHQKYKSGTFVRVAKELPVGMSHFSKDCDAMVEHTYAQDCGDFGIQTHKQYGLLIRDAKGKWSYHAWYDEKSLTEIKDKNKIRKYRKELNNEAA